MLTEVVEHRRGRLRWLSGARLGRAGVRHGFSLRSGGASRGAFASLNFSSRPGDVPERVRENWRRLESAAGMPARGWALLSQVHGARVERVATGSPSCRHRRGRLEFWFMVVGFQIMAIAWFQVGFHVHFSACHWSS